MPRTKQEKFERRRSKVRSKVFGTADVPRLNIFRSSKNLFAQIIDDQKGKTLVGVSTKSLKTGEQKDKKAKRAFLLGELVAKKALQKKIKSVVFDRSGYKYHGRVKAFAEGARKGGLKF